MPGLSEMVNLARVAFNDQMQRSLEQRENPLMGTFQNIDIVANQTYWDTIGPISLDLTTNDFEAVNPTQPDMGRRKITWKHFDKPLAVSMDQIRRAREVRPEFIPALQQAAVEKEIEEMIDSFEATAYAGDTGDTATAFTAVDMVDTPATGNVIPADANDDGTGHTAAARSMVYSKVRMINKFATKRKWSSTDPVYCLISEEELDAMRQISQFNDSTLITTSKTPAARVQTFNWEFINWIVLPSGFFNTGASIVGALGNVRYCYAWTLSAMRFGWVKNAETRLDDTGARTRNNNTFQFKINHAFGTTRGRENGVFRVESRL